MKLKSQNIKTLACFLVACPSVNALPINSYPNGLTGGVGLGTTSFITKISEDVFAINTTAYADAKIKTSGVLGNLFLGYGKSFRHNLYLGGELGLNLLGTRKNTLWNPTHNTNTSTTTNTIIDIPLSSATTTTNSSLSTSTTMTENTVIPTLDIKPGLVIHDNALLFARLVPRQHLILG